MPTPPEGLPQAPAAPLQDKDYVYPPSEEQRRTDLLVQYAKAAQEQGDFEGAKQKLLDAGRIIYGKDPERQKMVVAFLKEIGGDAAVLELAGSLPKEPTPKPKADAEAGSVLEHINTRYAAVQRMLIAFGSLHGWQESVAELLKEHPEGLTDEERSELGSLTPETFAPRVPALKTELQSLIEQRSQAMASRK